MFERFTEPARRVVVLAQEDARERGDQSIGSEHLLLALCGAGDTRGAALLAAQDVTVAAVEADLRRGERPGGPDLPDREALASVGIDLDEVRGRIEDAFGPGALESTRAAGRGRRRLWGHIPFEHGREEGARVRAARGGAPGRPVAGHRAPGPGPAPRGDRAGVGPAPRPRAHPRRDARGARRLALSDVTGGRALAGPSRQTAGEPRRSWSRRVWTEP